MERCVEIVFEEMRQNAEEIDEEYDANAQQNIFQPKQMGNPGKHSVCVRINNEKKGGNENEANKNCQWVICDSIVEKVLQNLHQVFDMSLWNTCKTNESKKNSTWREKLFTKRNFIDF